MFFRESFGRIIVSCHKNCRNSRTSNDIDMKHLASCWQNVTSLLFFQFMANLEQSGSPIPNMWSLKPFISRLSFIFYLSKSGSRTKKYLTQYSTHFFKWRYYFCQKMLTSPKLKRSFSRKVYFLKPNTCLYIRPKFQVSSQILISFRQGFLTQPPPQNEPLKSPPRLGLIVYNVKS